jgi:hypothetical protein
MFQEQRAEACFFLILHLLFIAQVAHFVGADEIIYEQL